MNRREWLAMTAVIPGLARAGMTENGEKFRPKLAIIMDDLGYRERDSYAAIELPAALTVAILPHTQHSEALSTGAQAFGHEVMLHLPMQASNGKYLGQGGLTLDMDAAQIEHCVKAGFDSVPGAVGFNNHMGSAFSQSPGALSKVMLEARGRAEYFVDSLTHADSVAAKIARLMGLKSATRDVFIDHAEDELSVPERIESLLARQTRLPTVAICHPRPDTIETLARRWSWLEDHFELVPASQVVA